MGSLLGAQQEVLRYLFISGGIWVHKKVVLFHTSLVLNCQGLHLILACIYYRITALHMISFLLFFRNNHGINMLK